MSKNEKKESVEELNTSATHYPARPEEGEISLHTLTMVVRDRAGTLARIVGLFSARNYNIDSLSVSNIDPKNELSTITLTTKGSDKVLDGIQKQLERLVNVYCVTNVSGSKDRVLRELALVKVKAEGEKRMEALFIANSFHANIVDASEDSVIIEMSGAPRKVTTFIDVIRPLGVIEVVRGGPVGMINSTYSPLIEIVGEDE